MKPKNKMAKRKFKGTLKKELSNVYGSSLKEGQSVIVTKRRIYDEKNFWNGKFEYYYTDIEGKILIRSSEFLI